MKRFITTILLLIISASFTAQEVITLKFTSCTGNGLYCPFSSVCVTNLTKDWSDSLIYPDTVLILENTLGVEDINKENNIFCLGNVYPNPFCGEAYVVLKLYEDRDVLIQVLQTEGTIVVSKTLHLTQGKYCVRLSLAVSQLVYLSISSGPLYQVVKLFNTGCSDKNSIDVGFISGIEKPNYDRTIANGGIEPGDLMRYEAQYVDGDFVVNSASVIQHQYYDETVTLLFDLDLPTVLTKEVAEITWNSAICVGEVSNDGNAVVTESGVCWSKYPNPNVYDNHVVSENNLGVFRVSLSDLEANTTYYVRAYAVNSIGINYGDEIIFVTSDLPCYTIEALTNYDNAGSVSGGGNYQFGQTCTLHANANTGYYFVGWTQNGNQISTNTDYTFIVDGNQRIVAYFYPLYQFYEGQCEDYSIFSGQTNTSSVYLAFDSLMARHPNFITKQCIGTACDGQDLFCYDFGTADGFEKPKIIIICSQHGFEKNSSYGTFFFLKDVAENDGINPFLDYVHNNLHFIIVPVVNPSGFDAFTYKNANGVNLNRNWPVDNWTITEMPSHYNYSGLLPLDQPETRQVDSIINYNMNADLFIDFHTNGAGTVNSVELLNWLSYPRIEDTLTRRVLLDLSNTHLDSVSANFKRVYGVGRPVIVDAPSLGCITIAQQYGTTGYADVSMVQRGVLALTFEGFNGFPGDTSPFLPDVAKANSELIGDFIYWFCKSFLTGSFSCQKNNKKK